MSTLKRLCANTLLILSCSFVVIFCTQAASMVYRCYSRLHQYTTTELLNLSFHDGWLATAQSLTPLDGITVALLGFFIVALLLRHYLVSHGVQHGIEYRVATRFVHFMSGGILLFCTQTSVFLLVTVTRLFLNRASSLQQFSITDWVSFFDTNMVVSTMISIVLLGSALFIRSRLKTTATLLFVLIALICFVGSGMTYQLSIFFSYYSKAHLLQSITIAQWHAQLNSFITISLGFAHLPLIAALIYIPAQNWAARLTPTYPQ